MISTHSRIAAFALVAAMLYAMLPMNVLAASDVKTQPRNVRTATAAASAGASLEGFCVTSVETDGKTASVRYKASQDCMLVVALYTEDGVKMLGSGKVTVSSNRHTANVTVAIDEMPAYYLVRAFLVNPGDNQPLSEMFTSNLYTMLSIIDSGQCGKNITYTLDNHGLLTLNGSGEMYDYSETVNIPWCSERNRIKKITLSDGITSIGKNAFYDCSELTDISIPDTVRKIGANAFGYCTDLASVTIAESVSKIGESAFDHCTGLTSVTIPDSVTEIGTAAFRNCTSLERAAISDTVTTINASVFAYCSSLKSVTVPNYVTMIYNNAFYNCGNLSDVYYSGSDDAWYDIIIREGNDNLLNANIHYNAVPLQSGKCGDNMTFTLYRSGLFELKGSGAMYNFERDDAVPWYENRARIRSVTISDGITSIGSRAWNGCTGITDAAVPESVTSIGDSAFANCSDLKTIILGSKISTIGSNAFSNCFGLQSITLTGKLSTIGNRAFSNCTGLQNISIPRSVTDVADHAFSGCSNLSIVFYEGTGQEWNNISIGSSNQPLQNADIQYDCVTRSSGKCGDNIDYILYENGILRLSGFGTMNQFEYTPEKLENDGYSSQYTPEYCSSPFYNHSEIKTVIMTGEITTIGNYAFYRCTGLTSLTFPQSLVLIEDNSFGGCTGLTSITMPHAVRSVGEGAFSGCTGLKSIHIAPSVTSIGNNAFQGCKRLTSVTIPDSVTTIGNHVFYECAALTNITLPNTVTSIGEYAFYGCKSLTSLVIPNAVTSIGKYAFSECTGLSGITISDSVTAISFHAFSGCILLTSVMIPDSVTSIGNYAFYGCSGLTDVTISDSVTTIGNHAFRGCTNLTELTVPNSVKAIGTYAFYGCKALTAVNLPNSLSLIGEKAFYGCLQLKTITIPKSITSIESNAFYNCNQLSDVYFTGSENDWQDLNIAQGNEALSSATIHYNAALPDSSPVPMRAPDAEGVQTASYDNLVPGRNYLFVVSRSGDTGNILNADKLLYIDQKQADGQGRITFRYQPKENYDGAAVRLFGTYNMTVSSIEVKRQPNRLYYDTGDSIDLTGLVLTVTYSDGSTSDVTEGYSYTPDSFPHGSTYGTSVTPSVTVEFGGKTVRVYVHVNEKLFIVTHPSDMTLKVGEEATFSVEAKGSIVSYQWYYKKAGQTNWNKWGTRTTAQTTATANASWDGMQVYCNVKDFYGKSVNSDPATISMVKNISITQQPESQTITLGDSVTLSLEVQGNGLTYQWYFMKAGQTAFSVWNGRTHPSETCTPNATWDNIQLYCVVKDSDSFSLKSDTITVRVNPGIVITKQPVNVSTKANKPVNLSVTATGNNLQYQWYYKKKGAADFSLWKEFTTAAIQPPANNSWDGMQVRCLITDSDGHKVFTDTATINLLPYATDDFQITTQPKSVNIDKANVGSQSVTFSVKVKNGSGVRYQWYFCKANQSTFTAWKGHTSASETVTPNSTWEKIQLYCKITNGNGEELYSDIAKVTFSENPIVITRQPTNQTISFGSPVTLSLTAKGIGLTYQWYFKKPAQTSFSLWKGHTHATESCTPTESWNGIQLYCLVKDASGNKVQSQTVKVILSDVITIVSQPSSVTTKTGENVKFTVKAEGDGLTYQWYYRKAGANDWSKWGARTTASTTATSNASWDGMQVRCTVTNAGGKSLHTNAVKITLSDVLAITQQPSDVTVNAGDNTTFAVKAKGEGLTYQWYYRKAGATDWSKWGARTTASTTATANSSWNGMQVRCVVNDSKSNTVTSTAAKITIR